MKISLVLVCTCAVISIKRADGSSIGAPFYPLEPEDLAEGEIKELEYFEKYFHRPKRTLVPPDPVSGSASILTHLKNAAVAGTKHKVSGAVAAASTGAHTAVAQVGKSLGGAALGSAGAINFLKSALLTEAKNKIIGAAVGASAAAAGSANAIKGLKTAALTGISSKIGQIASGSAKAAASASGGLGLASAGAAKHLTAFAFKGIASKIASGSAKAAIGLATAGSSASGHSANALKGAVSSSADFIVQLQNALFAGIIKHIGLIAAGSAKAATGASSGIKTKIGLVSGDIAAGSADAINQLKHAVIAGTKKKIGKAASGLAGAITGAVGSASAGAGQLARGVVFESANLINNLKTAALVETKNKIGQIAGGSASLVAAGSAALAKGAVGSVSAISQAKTAALVGVAKKIGQVASASLGASAGTALKASSGIGQLSAGAVKGSIDTANQIKSAAIKGIATKIGQAASLSAGALAGSSAHLAKTSAAGSTHTKSAALSGSQYAIGAVASASIGHAAGLSAGISKRSLYSQPAEEFLDLPKRSESAWSSGSGHGSGDIINQLKSAVVSGLKKKIGQVARGSAGAIAGSSAGFSKGSFGGGDDAKEYHHHHESYEPSGPSYEHEHKPSLNVWELKKSVLNTLLQAVKAIKGGVLAIKGQLIKGSGYVVAGGGKLLAAGGDKVSSLGKNIISNAVLVHPHKEHHISSEYGHPPAGYSAPSGPPVVYDAPSHSSGPSYESHYESQYDHHNDKPLHGSHAGILLLKKIPSSKDTYHTSHSHPEESRVPAFKPISPTGPSLGSIVGKFFTASTSLDTAQPTPFGDTSHGETYESHGESHYAVEESHATLHPPAPTYYEEPRTKFDAVPPPSFQAPLEHKHVAPSDFGGHVPLPSAPATNYGGSYEESHNFVNFNDYLGAEASNKNEQIIKLTKGEILDHLESSPTLASSLISLPKDAPKSLDALKTSLKSNVVKKPESTFYRGDEKHSSEHALIEYGPTYTRFKKDPSTSSPSQNFVASKDNSLEHFLPKGSPLTPSNSKEVFDGLSSAESYQKYLEHFPFHKVIPHPSASTHSKSSKYKHPQKLRMQSEHRQRSPSSMKGGYSLVKSVSYEITPDEAKRLT